MDKNKSVQKIAAIDLGTNSFLCLIAEVTGLGQQASVKKIVDVSRVVRLGEKVHQNRRFLPEALRRAETCLDEFEQIIKKNKVDKVIATATSAARDAQNGHELMDMGRRHGIPIHIIEGSQEAELSFEGAISGAPDAKNKKVLVVDVGGGSTELIYREPGQTIRGRSFDVGCVRLTEMFLKKDPVDFAEYTALKSYGAKVLNDYGTVTPDLVIAVAGTPTTLACVVQKIDFDEEKVEGQILTSADIERLAANLGSIPLEKRKNIRGLEPMRADVIVAGCALLTCALDVANRESLRVSTRGLRYGVALHHGEFK